MPPPEIYTVGHSNHPWDAFLELLASVPIQVIVDVRSAPYSKYASQFNKEPLEAGLRAAGIRYVFLGEALGGRPQDDGYYTDAGRVSYVDVAESPAFRQGLDRLLQGAATYTVALLCGEEDPSHCHRRLLVGKALARRGMQVRHLRGDGRVQSEEELTAEEDFRKNKGQMSLFAQEEADAWTSTPSVSPKKVRRNSSKP